METAKGGSKMALVLYISLRRTKPDLPADALANVVRHMDVSAIKSADEDEADPLEEDVAATSDMSSVTEGQQTGGRLRSAS